MSEPYDSRRMSRVLHLAMEEILGREGMRSLLECAGLEAGSGDATGGEFNERELFSASRLGRALVALEEQCGGPAGRGLAQRIGRACFQHGLREYGDALGVTSMSFRLLPFPTKLKTFAGKLAEMFTIMSGDHIEVVQADGKLQWRMAPCPFCGGQRAEQAICSLPAGLAEEALYWLSGGKMFNVEEVACIARGDPACIVQVDETPL